MKLKCPDCDLEFEVKQVTGKHTINKAEQLCCPYCQSEVMEARK